MSPIATNLLLVLGGAIVGSFVNWAIYNLCFDERDPISPWSRPGDKASKRTWIDYLPVIGWFFLKRDDQYHGKRHWVRPMLIELACIIGAVWFYHWQIGSGLTGKQIAVPFGTTIVWFSGHSLLIVLMLIATFIDFDEKTIPDWITIPGTIAALLFAAFWPTFQLPELVNAPGGIGQVMQHVHFGSPDDIPGWHHDWRGLSFVVGVLALWAFAIMPIMHILFRFFVKAFQRNPSRSLGMLWAFIIQPARKTECAIRVEQRKSFWPNHLPIIATMGLIFMVLTGLSIYLFYQPNRAIWDNFFSAVFGMAFGGGMVWAVRIVGGIAMQQEAMGFGDVTLMAMIGAFLGWQAALLTFVMAPFAAMLIAFVQLISTGKNDIAFGPYLCLAALILLIAWDLVWNDWASPRLFAVGHYLFYMLFGGLILLGVMLAAIQFAKGFYLEEET